MHVPTITISEGAAANIRQHGEQAFPFECCGFLYGDEKNGRNIALALPAPNSKEGDQRRRFEISPQDYLAAEQYAVAHGTQLLGIYHSHPNHPAVASEHDLAVAMPYFSYVIVSVLDGVSADVKSWRLEEEDRLFVEEQVILGSGTRNP